MASILDDLDFNDRVKPKASVGDFAKQVGASAIEGVGYGFQGGGQLLASGINAVAGTNLRAANPLEAPVKSIRDTISAGGQAAMRDTAGGDLFKPDTWTMPETGSGYAMTLAQGLGSAASTVLPAVGVLGRGATAAKVAGGVSGGLQAGGAAAEESRKGFADQYGQMADVDLQAELPAYAELRASGIPEAEARDTLANRGALYSTVGAGAFGVGGGAVGGALISRIASGKALPSIMGGAVNSKAGRIAAGGATGAVGEGAQEVVENMGATGARNLAYGLDVTENITDDTFADFAAGAMTGGAVSASAAAISKVQPTPTEDNPAPLPVDRPDPAAGALSRAAAQLPAPAPVLALPAPEQAMYVDGQGNAQNVGPIRNVDGVMQAEAQGMPPINAGMRQALNEGQSPVGVQPNTVPAEEARRQDRTKVAALEQERADRQARAFVNRVNVQASEALQRGEEPRNTNTMPAGLDLADKQGAGRWLAEPYRNSVQGLVSQLTKGGDVAYVRNANDVITGRTPSINPLWWQNMDPSVKPGSVDQAKAVVEKALAGKSLGPKQARFIATMLDMTDEMRVDQQQAEQNEAILQEIDREINLESRRNNVDNQIGGRQFDLDEQDEAELYAYLDGKFEPFSLDDLTPEDIDSIRRDLIALDDTTEQTRMAGDNSEGEDNADYRSTVQARGQVPAQQGVSGDRDRDSQDGQTLPAGREPDDFDLESQTEEQLASQERARLDADQADTAARTQQEQRTRADSERNDFSLTGSNRTADVGAAAGQVDLLSTNTPEPVTAPAVTPERDDNQIPSIQGADIDGDWAQFSAESGTLGIPRADMPQIKAEHRGAMVNFLKARGVRHTESTVPATSLKPTQAEFSRKKVEAAKEYEGGDRAILVSRDGHVLDGHHQWIAKRDAGEDVRIIRLSRNINNLLAVVREFPSASQDGQGAQTNSSKYPPTNISIGDAVYWDGASYTVTGGVAGGITAEGVSAKLGSGVTSQKSIILMGDDAIGARRAAIERDESVAAQPPANTADTQVIDSESEPLEQARANMAGETPQQRTIASANADTSNPAPQERIEDFGEKLEGARKDYASKLKDAESLDIAASTLTQAWPEPDYQKLVENGADPWTVGLIRAAREEIPPKPRVAWKLRGWVTKVEALREMSKEVMADPEYAAKMKAEAGKNPVLREFVDKVDLYEVVGHSKSLKGIAVNSGSYTIFNGVKLDRPLVKWSIERKVKSGAFGNMPRQLATADTKTEVIEKFKAIHQKLDSVTAKADKTVRFGIYSTRGTTDYFIGKKIGKEVVRIKDGFDSAKEARAHLQDNQEGLESTLAKMKDLPKHRKETNSPRVGADHRANGDVSPEEFAEAFGFRGVQFGNYVEQGRRQQDMNRAYDALLDLAGILNVPARALSLNGELGLAFGARGKGGKNSAAAHYESGRIVINLTKNDGAGTLAHEWWHALDNYFTRARGAASSQSFATEGSPDGNVRQEVVEAFREVTRTVNRSGMLARSQSLDTTRSKAYWSTTREMTARAFESYAIEKMRDQGASNDYLANIVSPEYWAAAEGMGIEEGGRYPYPEAAEIPAVRTAYDNFFNVVESKEGDDGNVVLFQRRSVGASGFVSRGDVVKLAVGKMGNDTISRRFRFLDYPELPSDIKDAAANQGIQPGEVRAVHWRGTTYMVDDRFPTAEEAVGAMFHEHYVHFGLRAKYGRGLRFKLGKLLGGVGGLKGVRDLAKKQGIDLSDYEQGLAGDPTTSSESRGLVLMEELMAHMGETTGTLRRIVEEFVGMMRAWLRDSGYADMSQLGVTDLAFELRGARQAAIAADRALPAESDQPMFQRAAGAVGTDAFKRWFGDSKVVDEQGRPLVVYHGTAADFDSFDNSKTGANDRGLWGRGHYFSASVDNANSYALRQGDGARLIPAYASIKNPLVLTTSSDLVTRLPDGKNYRDLVGENLDGSKIKQMAVDAGHDGVIQIRPNGQIGDLVAYSPEQIKSAIGNNGDFDPQNNDIRFRTTSSKPKARITLDQAKDVARELSAKGIPVIAVETEAGLPEDIQVAIERRGWQGRVGGVYRNGRAYIVAANLESVDRAYAVALHEVVGHAGIKGVLGNRLNGVMRQVYRDMPKDVRDMLIKRYGKQLDEMTKAVAEQTVGEEYVAILSETDPQNSLLQRVIAAVRNFLRQRFGADIRWNKADLIRMLADSKRYLAENYVVTSDGLFSVEAEGQDADNNGDFDPGNNDIRFSLSDQAVTDEALRKLGLKPEAAKTLREKITAMQTGDLRNLLADWGKRAKEGVFDGLNGIKEAEVAVGVTDPNRQGYVSARMATGIADVMHAVMHYGAPEWSGGIIAPRADTRGLLDILGELGNDNLTDWLGWLGGKRAQMLKKQGRENNLSDAEIDELLALGGDNAALFERVYREYAKINEAVLDVAQEAGLVKGDDRAKWATEYYVPFYRVTEEGLFTAPRGKKGLSHQSAGIKALKGGKVPTNDLLENILTNWTKRLDASLKNKALLEVVDNLKGSDYLTNQDLKWQRMVVPRNEVVKKIKGDRVALEFWAEQLGLDETANHLEIAHELNKLDTRGYEELWGRVAPTEPDVIRAQRDGKSEYYKVNDESLLRGLKHIEGTVFNDPVTKIGRAFKRLLTTGVTASPDFILRNFIRDAAHAWVINKDGYKLGIDSLKGLKQAFAEDPDYRDMMFSGSSFQGGYVHGNDPEAAAQIIRRALEKKGMGKAARDRHMSSLITTPAQMSDLLLQGWQKYRGVGDKIENANRLATYKASIAAGKSKREAAFEAKDLMDYSLRGNFAAAQWFTDVVPFLNARLQGLYKLGRAAKGDKSLIAKEIAIKGGYIAAFSVLLAGLNGDDERYKELPEWDKDMHWHIWLGEEHFRIPKPFELGIVFGTIPERMLMAMTGNQTGEQLTSAVARGFFETLAFNPVPQFYQPIREIQANRNFFRDMPIEGMADEGKLPEARYDNRTSALGIALGQVTGPTMGISPKQIDHLIQGYTGTLGGYVLSMSTLIADMGQPGEAPDRRLSDLPVAKVLYSGKDPRSTQYHTQFYDMLGEADQIYRTMRSYREEGRVDAAEALMEKEGNKLKYRSALGSARQQFGGIRKQMTAIYDNEEMSGTEKRRRLNELQDRSNQLAKKIVDMAGAEF